MTPFFESQIPKDDYAMDLVEINNHYYHSIVVKFDTNNVGGILYKLKQNGDIVDSLVFQKSSGDYHLDYLYTENSLIYAFGSYESDSMPVYQDLIFLKIDTNLNILKEYHYITNLHKFGVLNGLINFRNNFVIYSYGFTPGNSMNSFIFEIDHSGGLLHTYYQQTSNDDFIFSCTNIGTNLLVFLHSSTYMQQTGNSDNFLTLDSTYNFIRADSIPFLDNMETANSIGNKIYLSGKNINSGNYEIIKMDTTLQIFHHLSFGAIDTLDFPATMQSHVISSNNSIFLLGTINVDIINYYYSTHPSWIEISKLDTALNIIWTKRIGGDAHYNARNLTPLEDGGVIVSAIRYDFDTLQQVDNVLFKLDNNGVITVIKGSLPSEINTVAYPNPTTDFVYFSFAENQQSIKTVSIYNMQGQIVKTESVNKQNSKISLKSLPAGLYFYRITENNKLLQTGKIVKQ